ncbi:MAG: hypothetical protein KGJ10_01950 [Acidobacteriota bacterium]|nr:hypothetical protein [Acidobacteriota bacterium]MDE3043574.1 hypothetical protein [Acidobacteriota bacterium]MDE3107361.1 hypothetical protein [Acidobacteriota bacterium]MDE3222580.1 hypothetical protein [Acidobacteriota bacterium]
MSLVISRRRCLRRLARFRRHRYGRWVVGLAMSASVGVVPAATSVAAAPPRPLPCAAPQLHVSLTTNPSTVLVGQTVATRAILENVSTVACTVTIGGTTPTFTVYDRAGVAVWSYCDSLVKSEMCPQFLRLVTLAPGHRIVTTASWATSSVAPATTAGTYRLEWRLVGTNISASSSIHLASSASVSRVITEADAGHVVTLKVGQSLELRLSSSTYVWSTPRLSNPSVVTPVSSATASPPTFVAASPGRVVLSTVGTPRCYPQCLMPSRLVRVVLRVRQPSLGGE